MRQTCFFWRTDYSAMCALPFLGSNSNNRNENNSDNITFRPVTTLDSIQYILDVISKEVRVEYTLVKHLVYAGWSCYTNDPINLLVNSRKPGEGKSHPITRVLSFFPKTDVILLAGSSDKALYHEKGILVEEDDEGKYVSIQPKIDALELDKLNVEKAYADKGNNITAVEKQERNFLLNEIDKNIKKLRKGASKLINLEHKIIVFLDTPNTALLEALIPLLSHDEYVSKYKFTDTNRGGTAESTDNILWGWPTVILAQTLDISHKQRFPELSRRFIIVNPNTSPEKVKASGYLAIESGSLPDLAYQSEVVRDSELATVKDLVLELKRTFIEFSEGLRTPDRKYDKRKSAVLCPFDKALKEALPMRDMTGDVTNIKRFMRFQNLSAITNVNQRPIMKVTPRQELDHPTKVLGVNENPPRTKEIPIAVFADALKAVEMLKDASNTGVRPEIMQWYQEVFIPTYKDKSKPDMKIVDAGKKSEKIITEERIALKVEELVKATKKIWRKVISSKQIREQYLEPLVNNSILEKDTSEIKKSTNIFYPVSALTELDLPEEAQNEAETDSSASKTQESNEKLRREDLRHNFIEGGTLHLPSFAGFVDKDTIKSRIEQVSNYYAEGGYVVKYFDGRTTETELDTLINIYFHEFQAQDVFECDVTPPSAVYFRNGQNTDDSQASEQEPEKTIESDAEPSTKKRREDPRRNFSGNVESSEPVIVEQTVEPTTTAEPVEQTSNNNNDIASESRAILEKNPQADRRVQTRTTLKRSEAITQLLSQVDQLTREDKSLLALTIKDSAISFDCEYYDKEMGGKLFLFGVKDMLTEQTLESIRITDPHIAGNYPRFVRSIVTAIQKRQNKNEKGEVIDSFGNNVNEQSFGWWTRGNDSDLEKIDQACKETGVTSPIGYNWNKPYVIGQEHIDLHAIYENRLVQGSGYFKNRYRSLRLGHVGERVIGLGKYKGLTGPEMFELPPEEQKAYNLRDCELVAKLAKVDDGTLLALMKIISELNLMPFDRTCHTTLTKWWAHLFRSENVQKAINPNTGEPYYWKYEGGLVEDPKTGLRINIRVLDVASLYPTMARIYNLSSNTINCECCRDDPRAQVPQDVLMSRDGTTRIERKYWICRKQKGDFCKFLDEFTDLRLHFKRTSKTETDPQKKKFYKVLADGLKIEVNGGYGCMGDQFFDFVDCRVAELITAFGRYTLRQIIKIAEENGGLTVIYGDTDSIFLEGDNATNTELIREFIKEANNALNIELEDDKLFKRAIIHSKKHYIGVYYDEDKKQDDAIVKGIEGGKHDRALFINRMHEQFVSDFVAGVDPWTNIARELKRLVNRELSPQDLKIEVQLHQDQYEENDIKHKMMTLMSAKNGDLVWYYKIHNGNTERAKLLERKDGGYQAHQNPKNISYEKALDDAERTFSGLLSHLGMTPEELFRPYWNEVPKDQSDPFQQTLGGGREGGIAA
jgi:hypothetical protein